MRHERWEIIVLIAIMFAIGLLLILKAPSEAACRPAPEINPEWYPTNCVGDVAYGRGMASGWAGPGVARNDCLWPWTHCTVIRITSVETGRSIVVRPTMYGDLWRGLEPGTTGPLGERPRLVDLDPASRAALGLTGFRLWPVVVCPIDQSATGEREACWEARHSAMTPSSALPDTAMMP